MLASPGRPIRPCEHEGNLVAGGSEPDEGLLGEIRRAGKN